MSKIEWTEKTWNPISGCSKISPGCKNCYAERMAKRLAGRAGYPKNNPFKVTIHQDKIDLPVTWTRPTKIFVCSMGDLFHEEIDFVWTSRIFDVMRDCNYLERKHIFFILTKRPEIMVRFFKYYRKKILFSKDEPITLMENIWLGVTAENQEQADKRIPILLSIPAAVRFVSVEPMLEPINIEKYLRCQGCGYSQKDMDTYWDHDLCKNPTNKLSWSVIGAESGPRARKIDNSHIFNLILQCSDADVPVFLKQAWINGKLVKMPQLRGQRWSEMPKGEE